MVPLLQTFDEFHLRKNNDPVGGGTVYLGVERDMPIKVVLQYHFYSMHDYNMTTVQ